MASSQVVDCTCRATVGRRALEGQTQQRTANNKYNSSKTRYFSSAFNVIVWQLLFWLTYRTHLCYTIHSVVEEEDFCTDSKVHYEELITFVALWGKRKRRFVYEPVRVYPIKLAYDRSQPDSRPRIGQWLNRLGQYVSSPTVTQNSPFLP